jgi:hypothetical protein
MITDFFALRRSPLGPIAANLNVFKDIPTNAANRVIINGLRSPRRVVKYADIAPRRYRT